MNVGPAVSSRLALQRFFARTDFVTAKTSISRRSRPGSAAPFKGSRPDRLVFMLSTLSTSQAPKRPRCGNEPVQLAAEDGAVAVATSWQDGDDDWQPGDLIRVYFLASYS